MRSDEGMGLFRAPCCCGTLCYRSHEPDKVLMEALSPSEVKSCVQGKGLEATFRARLDQVTAAAAASVLGDRWRVSCSSLGAIVYLPIVYLTVLLLLLRLDASEQGASSRYGKGLARGH